MSWAVRFCPLSERLSWTRCGTAGTLRGEDLGSNLHALGIPEKTIQVILRHANVSTTNTYYIKTAPTDATAAMARLESAVPRLGNDWATKTNDSQLPVAVN